MSERYSRLLAALVNRLTAPQHPWRRANTRLKIANRLIQTHKVATRHGALVFVTTHPEELQFPRHLTEREPETIDWIDGFDPPCTFWDIGASVGSFSLYAALRPGVATLAFEPGPATFAALCRNIEANGSGDRVQAFCVALCGGTRLGNLNMSATIAGGTFNSFEHPADCFGRALAIKYRQAAIGFSIDDFRRLFDLAPPNYLKIDVDGIEDRMLAGGVEVLANAALRSVLIEMEDADTARNERIVSHLARAGLVLTGRGVRQDGVVNGIFTRPVARREAAQ